MSWISVPNEDANEKSEVAVAVLCLPLHPGATHLLTDPSSLLMRPDPVVPPLPRPTASNQLMPLFLFLLLLSLLLMLLLLLPLML